MAELMIAVGIVGVLSSIAFSSLHNYIRTAKSAEAPVLLSSVVGAEISYYLKPRVSVTTGKEVNACFLAFDDMLSQPADDLLTKHAYIASPNAKAIGFGTTSTVYFNYGVDQSYIWEGTLYGDTSVWSTGEAGQCKNISDEPLPPEPNKTYMYAVASSHNYPAWLVTHPDSFALVRSLGTNAAGEPISGEMIVLEGTPRDHSGDDDD